MFEIEIICNPLKIKIKDTARTGYGFYFRGLQIISISKGLERHRKDRSRLEGDGRVC